MNGMKCSTSYMVFHKDDRLRRRNGNDQSPIESHHHLDTISLPLWKKRRIENVIMLFARLFTFSQMVMLVYSTPNNENTIPLINGNENVLEVQYKEVVTRNYFRSTVNDKRKAPIKETEKNTLLNLNIIRKLPSEERFQPTNRQLNTIWCDKTYDDETDDSPCYLTDDFLNSTAYYEEYAQTTLWDMLDTPPHYWTATQWGFFSAIMTMFAFLSCCFCCTWCTQFCTPCIRCYANCI